MPVAQSLIITNDGAVLGKVTFGPSDEVNMFDSGALPLVGAPISAGVGRGISSVPSSRASAGSHHQRRIGSGHAGSHDNTGSHTSRHLDAPNKHGPTFRPGLSPRGAAEPDKPQHITLGDVKGAVEGGHADLSTHTGRIAIAKKASQDQLRKEGVPEKHVEEASNLLIGQALSESGSLNPLESHDGGTGLGIYGAGHGRKTAMLNWLKDNGYPVNSLEGQAKYMAHEAMTGGYPRTKNILLNADPANRATNTPVITGEFEAPAVTNYRTGNVNQAASIPAQGSGNPVGITRLPAARQANINAATATSAMNLPPGVDAITGGINREQFRPEIEGNPELVKKMAHMVFGEVGKDAPLNAKIVQLETLFNRSQYRSHSLEQGLLSVSEDPIRGYYEGRGGSGGGTYRPSMAPTESELEDFKRDVLAPVMRGTNISDIGLGPMTGNASGATAASQFARHTPGYHLPGGDTYFREGPFPFTLPRNKPIIHGSPL